MTTVRAGRKKTKNPPYFSHEFVIQNHGDIVSFVAMIIVIGLLYRGTHSFCSNFVFVQHNVTDEERPDSAPLYSPGRYDFCLVFFYTLITIVVHAVLQEYVFDRFEKKLDLTKVRIGKYNESVYLTVFYILSVAWGVYNVVNENLIPSLSSLWDGYPHSLLPFWTKMFLIIQMCFWLHDYPELYFQRVKSDLIPARILHATMFLIGIAFAYIGGLSKLCMVLLIIHYATDVFLHAARALHLADYTKIAAVGFTIWNIVFIPVRMACIILPFLVLHYGLGNHSVSMIDFQTGNYNTPTIRSTAMIFLFISQAYMVWNFITFHQRSRRDKQSRLSFKLGWFGSGSQESGSGKKKDKKKAKREEEEQLSDGVTADNATDQRDVRRRKANKSRSPN